MEKGLQVYGYTIMTSHIHLQRKKKIGFIVAQEIMQTYLLHQKLCLINKRMSFQKQRADALSIKAPTDVGASWHAQAGGHKFAQDSIGVADYPISMEVLDNTPLTSTIILQ